MFRRNVGSLSLDDTALYIPLDGALHSYLKSKTLKITVFWDMTPCSFVDRHQHFRETCVLHLQPRGLAYP
jgi:hypothetical protein